MDASTLLDRTLGAAPIRSLVNRGYHAYARRRMGVMAQADPTTVQERILLGLVRKARETRFGRDHGFATIRSVADFQAAVPLRSTRTSGMTTSRTGYPIFDDLTWPGRIPFLALDQRHDAGGDEVHPGLARDARLEHARRRMSMVASDMASHPDSRLFRGRMFFLGGSTDLKSPGPGVSHGRPERDHRQDGVPGAPPLHLPAAGAGARPGLGPQAQHARRAEPRRADHAGLRACRAGCWPSSSGSRS